jgi:hypothetical protein
MWACGPIVVLGKQSPSEQFVEPSNGESFHHHNCEAEKKRKEADVDEHPPERSSGVGLLVDEPLGSAEMPFA